jgi:hypothetical protein
VEHNTLKMRLPSNETAYYFGSAGFALDSRESFDAAQVGYRVHSDGTDLTGANAGDWRDTWYVIGRDTTVGDPFFVDLSSDKLPVYTAMHGTGSWDPELVSATFSGFLAGLELLQNSSGQDMDLVDPDETTIRDDAELEDIRTQILSVCGEDSAFFWECFFEQHQEWIAESEEWED